MFLWFKLEAFVHVSDRKMIVSETSLLKRPFKGIPEALSHYDSFLENMQPNFAQFQFCHIVGCGFVSRNDASFTNGYPMKFTFEKYVQIIIFGSRRKNLVLGKKRLVLGAYFTKLLSNSLNVI